MIEVSLPVPSKHTENPVALSALLLALNGIACAIVVAGHHPVSQPLQLVQDSVLPAADWSMLPPLDRPKTLVDEQGRDLPTLQQDGPEQRRPQNGFASHSVEEKGAMLFLSSMEECKCLP